MTSNTTRSNPTDATASTTRTGPSGDADTTLPSAGRRGRRTTTVTPGPAPRRSTPLLAELDREWARLRRRPSALRLARSWSTDPVLGSVVTGLRDLADLVDATQSETTRSETTRSDAGQSDAGRNVDVRRGPTDSGPVPTADEVLHRLIELAANEELAGRIVLQRILPGVISRSRRWDGTDRGAHVCDIAVGAAWLAIRTFDVGSRTAHVAPSLISDALWIGFRRDSRRKAEQEVPVAGSVLVSRPAPPHQVSPIEALAGTLRAARRAGVPDADLALLRTISASGSPTQAARARKVTVRTIRNRRDAAAWKVRRALGADWADWTDPLVAA